MTNCRSRHSGNLRVMLLVLLCIVTLVNSALLGSWSQGTATMSYQYGAFPIGYHEPTHKIWILGGYPTSAKRHVFSFDLTNPTSFIQHADLTQDITAYAQTYVTINDVIYMIRDTGSSNKISTFNMATREFTPSWPVSNSVTLQYYTRNTAALVYHPNGYLIILGGTDQYGSAMRNFQILRLSNNQWFHGPNMVRYREEFCASIVNNKLYAIGDTNRVAKISVIDMENLPSTWTDLSDTLSGTDIYVRSVVYNNDIYVMGGDNGTPIDVIHSLTDTISNNVAYMSPTVRNGGAVIAMNKIYYFGGYCPSCSSVVNTYQYASLPTSNPTCMT